ncbi:MAG: protease SohB [Porticoccaceae bacterium]|nr:protease SohB [Porticoccaceae bacterium]|tara:strand:- start:105 stop:1136 length:1032 start_codon:yes stop_codon:yes gene_type:complete
MNFLIEYGMFLAKALTIIVSIGAVLSMIISASQKTNRGDDNGEIDILPLNIDFEKTKNKLRIATVEDSEKKIERKKIKQESKNKNALNSKSKKRIYVVNFEGNIAASAVENLREEITAILSIANKKDEIIVRLESSGGMVHSYGLASSQLDRIKKAKLKLTICIDKVAASGGYMMACVGDKIIAAPFAIVGSIGVVAQMPNFNKLLKKHDIDFELLTAGEHKRTLTLFGKNTDKGREKFIEELNETHGLFKEYVAQRRPNIDINKIASGEIWFGSRARELSLVDEISTSDEYICSCFNSAKVFEIKFVRKQKLLQRIGGSVESSITRIAEKLWSRFTNPNKNF